MKDLKVSICCITYNHEKYIKDAIEGFLMQKTNFSFEVLIHDDASTDNTAKIIKHYENKYPEIIRPIYQKNNQYSLGKKINFEFNFPRVKSKYIALCEGDDYWIDPLKLQKQVDYLEKNSQCSLSTHATKIIDQAKKPKIKYIKPYKKDTIIPPEMIIKGGGGFLATNSLVFLTSSIQNLPEWVFNFDVGDYPLQVLLSLKGEVFYFNKIMSVYRSNVKNSWSQRNKSNYSKVTFYDKRIKQLQNMKEGISFELASAVNYQIHLNKFKKHRVLGEKKHIKKKKYRDIWKSYSLFQRLKINIELYFPGIKKLWKKIKRYF